MTHTPGPWRYQWYASAYRIFTKSGRVICTISPASSYKKAHENNARLIALAPDMLAALKAINDCIYAKGLQLGGDDYFLIRELCVNLVKKAEGKLIL